MNIPGKRAAAVPVLLVLAAALLLFPLRARAEKVIHLTFAGDCTLGSTELTRPNADSFDSVIGEKGFDYPFARFAGLFSSDDRTVVNCEGVFSDSSWGENKNKTYRFRGPAEYTEIFRRASVEAVSLANNHVGDYGSRGLSATQGALEEGGIDWFRCGRVSFLEKDGIRIAFMAIDTTTVRDQLEPFRREISRLKESGEADAVVVCFHCGNEYDARRNAAQERVGRSFVDRGADLVIMHHSHVVQGVEITGNRTLLYSLGNFVFGGNSEIRTEPYGASSVTSLYCLVVRAELTFSDEGKYLGQQITLVPAFTSSDAPQNNYQPFPVSGADAEAVRAAVQFDTDFPLPEITEEDGLSVIRLPWLPADGR